MIGVDQSFEPAAPEARDFGRLLQEALGPDDPRLRGIVRLAHRDGTGMVLISAFVRREGDWVYVFTRNHGFLAYPADELTECKEYEPPPPGPTGPLPADDYAGPTAAADSGDEGGSVGFGDMPIRTGGLIAAG